MTFLVAQRYDRLGGRLSSLGLALFVSRTHNLPVRLSWPYGRVHPMHINPEDVFAPDFLEDRLIDPKEVRVRLAQQKDDPSVQPEMRVIDALDESEIPRDLDPGPIEPFKAVLPPSSFAPLIEDAMKTLAGQKYNGIHVRHGDLVDGQWRHFGHMERFVPYDATLHFIQRNSEPGEFRVHSDEPLAAQHLSDLAQNAGLKDFTFVPSHTFDGLDKDVFDIFHMAYAQDIIAPEKSAYSGFAAQYFGRPRHDQTPEVMQEWAEQNIKTPKDMISPLYSAKRNLFIMRILDELDLAEIYIDDIQRMLSHIEANCTDNAELYFQKMRFLPSSAPMADFERDLASYVAAMEDLKALMPARGGAVLLAQLIASLDAEDRRIAPMEDAIDTIHPLSKSERDAIPDR